MRGTRVKALRRKLATIQGRPPVAQIGPKAYQFLEKATQEDIDEGKKKIVKLPVSQKDGSKKLESFTLNHQVLQVTLLHEFRRFRRALRRGEVKLG